MSHGSHPNPILPHFCGEERDVLPVLDRLSDPGNQLVGDEWRTVDQRAITLLQHIGSEDGVEVVVEVGRPKQALVEKGLGQLDSKADHNPHAT